MVDKRGWTRLRCSWPAVQLSHCVWGLHTWGPRGSDPTAGEVTAADPVPPAPDKLSTTILNSSFFFPSPFSREARSRMYPLATCVVTSCRWRGARTPKRFLTWTRSAPVRAIIPLFNNPLCPVFDQRELAPFAIAPDAIVGIWRRIRFLMSLLKNKEILDAQTFFEEICPNFKGLNWLPNPAMEHHSKPG